MTDSKCHCYLNLDLFVRFTWAFALKGFGNNGFPIRNDKPRLVWILSCYRF